MSPLLALICNRNSTVALGRPVFADILSMDSLAPMWGTAAANRLHRLAIESVALPIVTAKLGRQVQRMLVSKLRTSK